MPLALIVVAHFAISLSRNFCKYSDDRSSAGTKPATLETGAQINVPLFINTGDKLKVDSRDGSYLGRVNA